MRLLPALLLSALLATPAAAAWSIHTSTDRMRDRPYITATLAPSTGLGTLRVRCVLGAPFPDIVYPERVAFYRTGVEYRFDNGPLTSFLARVAPNGTDVWAWTSDPSPSVLARFKSARRLRVQIGRDFMDFDLTGGAEALARVKCGR